MSIYTDNFICDNSGTKITNIPKLVPGTIVDRVSLDDYTYTIMNTGIILCRPNYYVETSPYGWSELHKDLKPGIVIHDKAKLDAWNSFELNCKCDISLLYAAIRPLCENKLYKKFKNNNDEKLFLIQINKYNKNRLITYRHYGYESFLHSVVSLFHFENIS